MENDLDTAALVDMFNESERSTYDARMEAERCRDYFDGKQLTQEELSALKKRGQPPVIINRIRRKIQWLRGLEIKQRTDPRAFPRNPDDEGAAEAATDALRFVADNTRFDRKKSAVWGDMLVEGFGGVEVVHKKTRKGVDIVVNRYPWDRLFYDPYSVEFDFADARYLGAVVWQDKSELIREYPKKKALIERMMTSTQGNETYDDKPRYGMWYDAKRDRVKVVMIWYKQGDTWKWCKFVEKDKLEGGESPYANEDGESVCPLILQSLYVSREADRYGIVRDMLSPQDEVNKRRSKALHLLNMRQVRVSPAVTDRAQLSRELAKPDGIVEAEDGDFEILPTGDMASGQVALLEEAKNEIDLMGANGALEGETGESSSGRAVLARQQGGLIEITPETDELAHFTQRVFEAFWDRIRQFWTEEKWVRVTDDERNLRFVGLNRPVTFGEQLGQQPPELVQQAAMQMGLVPNDPRLFQVVEVENSVAELMVDIIIEESPDRITLAGEIFEALAKYGPTLPPQVLIEADPVLPTSKKEKLLEALQSQQPTPEQQLSLEEKAAGIEETRAKAMKAAAEAQSLPLSAAAGL